jgi:hypothetical protein
MDILNESVSDFKLLRKTLVAVGSQIAEALCLHLCSIKLIYYKCLYHLVLSMASTLDAFRSYPRVA